MQRLWRSPLTDSNRRPPPDREMDRAADMGLAESLHLPWSTRTSPPPRSSGRPRGEVRRARIEDRPDFHAVRGVPPGPQRLTKRRSEAERDGFGLLWAVSGLERLRWAALGCDRSAPQLLHEMLPVLKTSMTRFPRDRLRIVLARERSLHTLRRWNCSDASGGG